MKKIIFITDNSQCTKITLDQTGEIIEIPRYVVWENRIDEEDPLVLESSNDLEYLLEKYNLCSDDMLQLSN